MKKRKTKKARAKKLNARQTFAEAMTKFNYGEMLNFAMHIRWAGEATGFFQKGCVKDSDIAVVLNKWAREYA